MGDNRYAPNERTSLIDVAGRAIQYLSLIGGVASICSDLSTPEKGVAIMSCCLFYIAGKSLIKIKQDNTSRDRFRELEKALKENRS